MLLLKPSKNLRVELLLFHMISVSFSVPVVFGLCDDLNFGWVGLISQVAEELWEVANKTIKNLTKYDISIVDYKKNLVKQS